MVVDLLRECLHECLCHGFYVSEEHLGKEWQEEDGIPGHPVSKILWFLQVANGIAEEELHLREADILAISRECTLNINQYYGWRLDGSH